MRRIIICVALLIIGITSYSQNFKLGIQFSPVISTNRISSEVVDTYINSNGSTFKLRFGPIADFAITDTYYFSTGLFFTPKSVAIEYVDDITTTLQKETYNLQYLQVPISLKLYTNEIMLDTKLYVKMGILSEFKIGEKQDTPYNLPLITKFSSFDTSLLLGLGIEHAIGTNTVLFGGLSYNRGLINALSKNRDVRNEPKLKIHNDLLNLDLGVKF